MMGMPMVPATQEAEVGRSQPEAGQGKGSVRPYLKSKLKAKRPRVWYSTYLEKKSAVLQPLLIGYRVVKGWDHMTEKGSVDEEA
jgi:hypothetical protein